MRKLFISLSLLIVGIIIFISALVIALLVILLAVVADEQLKKEILYIINDRNKSENRPPIWNGSKRTQQDERVLQRQIR